MKRYEHKFGKNPAGALSTTSGYATETTNFGETAFGILNKSTRDENNFTTPEVVSSSTATLFSVGNGTDTENRKNIIELKADGTVFISGVGGYNGTNSEDSTSVSNEFQNIHKDIEGIGEDIDHIDNTIESIHVEQESDLVYTFLVDGENRGTINIPRDQFLKDVNYNAETNDLEFLFLLRDENNDPVEKPVKINMTDLEDIYTNGDGLNLENKQFSIKIDADTQPYIDVTSNGLKIVGINEALDTKVDWQENKTSIFLPANGSLTALRNDGQGGGVLICQRSYDNEATYVTEVGTTKNNLTLNSIERPKIDFADGTSQNIAYESEVKSLQDRMSTAEADIDNLEGRMDTAESDIDAIQSDLSDLIGDGEGSVQDQIKTALEDYLPLSGGTMTGNITFGSESEDYTGGIIISGKSDTDLVNAVGSTTTIDNIREGLATEDALNEYKTSNDEKIQSIEDKLAQEIEAGNTDKETIDNYTVNGHKISENPVLTKTDVGLDQVDNVQQIPMSMKGQAGGVAELDANGKIPSSQLNGQLAHVFGVDGVVANQVALPAEGVLVGDIYYTIEDPNFYNYNGTSWDAPMAPKDDTIYNFRNSDATGNTDRTNILYRWDGAALVEISESLALGESTGTAYEGNKGAANRDALDSLPGYLVSGVTKGPVTNKDISIHVNVATKYGLNYGSLAPANFTLEAATSTAAGVMSAQDKSNLDTLWGETRSAVGSNIYTGANYISKETNLTGAVLQLDEEIKATNDNLALEHANAEATYAKKTELGDYLPLTGGTITGLLYTYNAINVTSQDYSGIPKGFITLEKGGYKYPSLTLGFGNNCPDLTNYPYGKSANDIIHAGSSVYNSTLKYRVSNYSGSYSTNLIHLGDPEDNRLPRMMYGWNNSNRDQKYPTFQGLALLTFGNSAEEYTSGMDLTNYYTIYNPNGVTIPDKTNQDLLHAAGGTISIQDIINQVPAPDLSHYATKEELNNYLPLSGGTLTGQLILQGHPILSRTITLSNMKSDDVDGYINAVFWANNDNSVEYGQIGYYNISTDTDESFIGITANYRNVADLPNAIWHDQEGDCLFKISATKGVYYNTHKLVENTELSNYLTKTDASNTYQPKGNYLTTIPSEYVTDSELNAKGYQTEAQVSAKVSALVNSAPETLDTLKELADALGNDPNFATTISTKIGTKLDTSTYNADKATFALKSELPDMSQYTTTTNLQSTYITKANASDTYQPKGNYLTSIPSEYVTDTELNAKGYVTKTIADSTYQPKGNYLTSVSWDQVGSKPSWIGSSKPSYTWDEIGSKPLLATVATSGSYNDLTNKPAIPSAVTVDSALSSTSTNPVQNKVINSALAGKANSSHTHTASQVSGLATVATSGSYNDLSNKPSIPQPTVKAASGTLTLWTGTESEYNAIATKDPNTLYFILES